MARVILTGESNWGVIAVFLILAGGAVAIIWFQSLAALSWGGGTMLLGLAVLGWGVTRNVVGSTSDGARRDGGLLGRGRLDLDDDLAKDCGDCGGDDPGGDCGGDGGGD